MNIKNIMQEIRDIQRGVEEGFEVTVDVCERTFQTITTTQIGSREQVVVTSLEPVYQLFIKRMREDGLL